MYRYLTKKRINQIAWKILQNEGVKKPWVDVEAIANQHGIEVTRDDLGNDISGLLITKTGKTVIGVNNQGHGENRQRFTIAHELGHFFLGHHREKGMFVDQSRHQFSLFLRNERSSEGTNQQEIEANAFAAALLMPEQFVRVELVALMETGKIFDLSSDNEEFIKSLSKTFKVSTMAMTYRIGNLDLFNTM